MSMRMSYTYTCVRGARVYSRLTASIPTRGTGSTVTQTGIKQLLEMNEWVDEMKELYSPSCNLITNSATYRKVCNDDGPRSFHNFVSF